MMTKTIVKGGIIAALAGVGLLLSVTDANALGHRRNRCCAPDPCCMPDPCCAPTPCCAPAPAPCCAPAATSCCGGGMAATGPAMQSQGQPTMAPPPAPHTSAYPPQSTYQQGGQQMQMQNSPSPSHVPGPPSPARVPGPPAAGGNAPMNPATPPRP